MNHRTDKKSSRLSLYWHGDCRITDESAETLSVFPTFHTHGVFSDMFDESSGSSDFNIAVIGTTGSGKTFTAQSVLGAMPDAGVREQRLELIKEIVERQLPRRGKRHHV
jgi:Cdc6-like AAA superfamily ATPase